MPGFVQKILKFLRGVRSEMRKVTWPNRAELISYTGVVIIFILIVAIYLGLADLVFTLMINPLL